MQGEEAEQRPENLKEEIRTLAERAPGPPGAGGGRTRIVEGLTRERSVRRGPGRGGAELARAVPLRRAARAGRAPL